MKKNLVLLALIGFAMFTLCGCGKEKLTVTGQNGQEYESYQECCAAGDFQAAHQFLAKMENSKEYDLWTLEDANRYVLKQEALYLMSIGNDAAQKRIIFLLKEGGQDNDLVSKLIDIAIDDDDQAFVKKLANQYTSGVNDESLKKLTEYLLLNSSAENKDYLRTLFKRLNNSNLLIYLAIVDNDIAFIDEYASSNLSLEDTSLIEFCAARNEKKYSEMIVGLLTQEESSISQKPQIGVTKAEGHYDFNSGYRIFKFENMCTSFSLSIMRFNEICKKLLGLAIKNKNQYLAQRVVSKFKSNIHYEKTKTNDADWAYFKVTTDNNDINEAKKTYEAAVRDGAFK